MMQPHNPISQQDNSRLHTAWTSMTCLRDVNMLPWPARSSDLSLIENVRGQIGRKLRLTASMVDIGMLVGPAVAVSCSGEHPTSVCLHARPYRHMSLRYVWTNNILLECSAYGKANRVRSSARPIPHFRVRESYRTMPLFDGFSRGLQFPRPLNSGATPLPPHFAIIDSQEPRECWAHAVKKRDLSTSSIGACLAPMLTVFDSRRRYHARDRARTMQLVAQGFLGDLPYSCVPVLIRTSLHARRISSNLLALLQSMIRMAEVGFVDCDWWEGGGVAARCQEQPAPLPASGLYTLRNVTPPSASRFLCVSGIRSRHDVWDGKETRVAVQRRESSGVERVGGSAMLYSRAIRLQPPRSFRSRFTRPSARGPRWFSGQTISPPTQAKPQSIPDGARVHVNLAGRCRWSMGFLGDLPFTNAPAFWRCSILTSLHYHRLFKTSVLRSAHNSSPNSESICLQRSEYGAAPERKSAGNGRSPRKPADQRHRPARLPHAKVQGVTPPGIESGSPRWGMSSLTTTPPRPLLDLLSHTTIVHRCDVTVRHRQRRAIVSRGLSYHRHCNTTIVHRCDVTVRHRQRRAIVSRGRSYHRHCSTTIVHRCDVTVHHRQRRAIVSRGRSYHRHFNCTRSRLNLPLQVGSVCITQATRLGAVTAKEESLQHDGSTGKPVLQERGRYPVRQIGPFATARRGEADVVQDVLNILMCRSRSADHSPGEHRIMASSCSRHDATSHGRCVAEFCPSVSPFTAPMLAVSNFPPAVHSCRHSTLCWLVVYSVFPHLALKIAQSSELPSLKTIFNPPGCQERASCDKRIAVVRGGVCGGMPLEITTCSWVTSLSLANSFAQLTGTGKRSDAGHSQIGCVRVLTNGQVLSRLHCEWLRRRSSETTAAGITLCGRAFTTDRNRFKHGSRVDMGKVRCVWSSVGMQGRGKREIHKKTRQPVATSGVILTCENLGATPPVTRIEAQKLFHLALIVCTGSEYGAVLECKSVETGSSPRKPAEQRHCWHDCYLPERHRQELNPVNVHERRDSEPPHHLGPSLTNKAVPSDVREWNAPTRPRSRSEGAIRATLTRTPSVSSLLRARRAVFPSAPSPFPIPLHSFTPPVSLCFCELYLDPGVSPFVTFHHVLAPDSILYYCLGIMPIAFQSSLTSFIQLFLVEHVAFQIFLVNLLSFILIRCPAILNLLFHITLEIGSTLPYSSRLDLWVQNSPCFLALVGYKTKGAGKTKMSKQRLCKEVNRAVRRVRPLHLVSGSNEALGMEIGRAFGPDRPAPVARRMAAGSSQSHFRAARLFRECEPGSPITSVVKVAWEGHAVVVPDHQIG
ncbi:hypothetical protein PR048_016203 [Dryococelus australis]|uniref:Uncharacterized protein n=1 Tax=Dryococelus australis TaxID=614101 RepID=A0ABQ9HJN7_9NEOP|nr:hypothetical protein PR048_016203 [Dryococelus australis]